MNTSLPNLLRADEAAQQLNVSERELYALIHSGRLPAQRIMSRIYRIKESDVLSFARHQQKESGVPPIVQAVSLAEVWSATPDLEGVPVSQPNPVPAELTPCYGIVGLRAIPEPETITVTYLMDEWLQEARGRIRSKTYLSYEQMVRLHVLPVLGEWQADKLNVRTVEKFLQWKHQSGLSARTVQYLRSVLRQAYNEGMRWGWLTKNPPALARGPKSEIKQIEVISKEEAQRLLQSFAEIRYGPMFVTILGMGLRIGEALGLRWSSVRWPDQNTSDAPGEIIIQVQLQKIGNVFQVVPPKSRSGIRTLSMPHFVAEAIIKRREEQKEERTLSKTLWRNEHNLVFTNKFGGPLDESRVRQRFHQHLKAQGFSRMRIHDLRHLAASLLLSEKTHPRVLMEILGHSQISLTMNTYAHVMPSAHPEVARSMEVAFSKKVGI